MALDNLHNVLLQLLFFLSFSKRPSLHSLITLLKRGKLGGRKLRSRPTHNPEKLYVYSLLKPVFYPQKMMNFMKMRTFYKKNYLFLDALASLDLKLSVGQ